MTKKLPAVLMATASVLILTGTAARAQAGPGPVDYRFYVAPMFTYSLVQDSRATANGLGGTLAFGKHVTRYLDLELTGNWQRYRVGAEDKAGIRNAEIAAGSTPNTQPDALRLWGVGAGANVYAFTGFDTFASALDNLYVHVDVMYGNAHGQPGLHSHYVSTVFDAGLGYNLSLPVTHGGLLPPGLALRVEALYRLDRHGHDHLGYHITDGSNNFHDIVFNRGGPENSDSRISGRVA